MTTDDIETYMFTNELLDALGAWQRGWQADEKRKKPITEELLRATAGLPARFRAAPEVCYRKRFLFKKDMEPLIMFDGLDDGVASWSTDCAYAQEFKGLVKREAVTAAYFEHRPDPDEVVVSFIALWADPGFREAAENYRVRGGKEADALFNFADKQSEVVLHAKLHTNEVKGMIGISSDFDAICDQAGIGEEERDETFRKLTEDKMYFGVPRWLSEEGAQRVLATVRRNFLERHAELIAFAAALRRRRPIWLSTVSHLAMIKPLGNL